MPKSDQSRFDRHRLDSTDEAHRYIGYLLNNGYSFDVVCWTTGIEIDVYFHSETSKANPPREWFLLSEKRA